MQNIKGDDARYSPNVIAETGITIYIRAKKESWGY
jgi:hypothetical protein